MPEKLAEPLRWKTPKMIFVNSMSDLFHKDVPDDYVEAVCRRHGASQLAHLPGADQAIVPAAGHAPDAAAFAAGLPHIWWGVSVEDRAHGLVRIKHLQQAPAAVRFLSIEPLLEDLGEINLEGIHWVIVGGESGAGATADGEGMGAVDSRSVRASPGSVLLQAVGRRPQEQGWPGTRWQDLRRPSRPGRVARPGATAIGWRRSPRSRRCIPPSHGGGRALSISDEISRISNARS